LSLSLLVGIALFRPSSRRSSPRTEAEPDEGEATIWVGTEPGELATPEAAIAVIALFADVPDTLASLLDAEMRAGRASADGALQSEMKRRLFGSIH
jgi:hypothetical protein